MFIQTTKLPPKTNAPEIKVGYSFKGSYNGEEIKTLVTVDKDIVEEIYNRILKRRESAKKESHKVELDRLANDLKQTLETNQVCYLVDDPRGIEEIYILYRYLTLELGINPKRRFIGPGFKTIALKTK